MSRNQRPDSVVPNWLWRRQQSDPNQIAIRHADVTWTYRQLWDQAMRVQHLLSQSGVPAGAMVGVMIRHGAWFAGAVHGCMQARRPVVPFNLRLSAAEIAFQVDDAAVPIIVCDDATESFAQEVLDLCSSRPTLCRVDRDKPVGIAEHVEPSIDLNATLAVIYTSGTTGRPKGAKLTYGNFLWSAMGSAIQLGLARQENWLVPMPLYHVGGLSVLIRSVIYGTTASVLDKFDECVVNEWIDAESITLLSVVPAMLHRLLRDRANRSFPSSLRTVLLGGSGADRHLLETCRDLGVPVAQSYGLTEATSQVCTLPVTDSLRKLGSSGKPLLPTEVKIVDGDGVELPPEQTGEIAIRGLTVSPGYLRRSSSTDEDGWFRTGDVGYLDSEGYLFVLDRRTDLIVSGGENVYPAEVEGVLLSVPDVLEAGVVGEEDPTWGHVPVAFVVLDEGSTLAEEQLVSYCRERLAGYKQPKRWIFVDHLPRNASGKLLRRTLREWL